MRYLTYLVLVVSTTLNAGTIHKWVDENGNVHYGDAPPVKTKTENVRVQAAPSNPGRALPRLSVPDNSRNAQQEISPEKASAICQAARKDLDIINTSDRIRVQEADGTERYLGDAEISERKSRAQNEVKQFCK